MFSCFSFPAGNAIQAFGYGSLPKPDPQPTTGSVKPDLEPTANVHKTTMDPGEELLNVSQILWGLWGSFSLVYCILLQVISLQCSYFILFFFSNLF